MEHSNLDESRKISNMSAEKNYVVAIDFGNTKHYDFVHDVTVDILLSILNKMVKNPTDENVTALVDLCIHNGNEEYYLMDLRNRFKPFSNKEIWYSENGVLLCGKTLRPLKICSVVIK